MDHFYAWLFNNLQLALFILAVILIIFHYVIRKHRTSGAEIIFQWMTLLPLGITLLFGAAMFLVYPEFTIAVMHYQMPPELLYALGIANLAFGLLAVLAYGARYGFRLASVVANTVWLWGCWFGGIYHMVMTSQVVVSSWMAVSILVPLILIICLFRLK